MFLIDLCPLQFGRGSSIPLLQKFPVSSPLRKYRQILILNFNFVIITALNNFEETDALFFPHEKTTYKLVLKKQIKLLFNTCLLEDKL